jgi:hypothetical protein
MGSLALLFHYRLDASYAVVAATVADGGSTNDSALAQRELRSFRASIMSSMRR